MRTPSWAYHLLGANLPVLLNVPEAQRAGGRRDSLGQSEIGILEERELELVVLADRDQCAGCVQALPRTRVNSR